MNETRMEKAQRLLRETVEMWNSVPEGETDDPARLLWRIYTALRGPDSENFADKDHGTAPYRALVGLKEDYSIDDVVYYSRVGAQVGGQLYIEGIVPGHFRSHLKQGIEALELLAGRE